MAVSVKFIESGSDATGGLEPWLSSSGSVSSTTDQAATGPRSILCASGAASFIQSASGGSINAGRASFRVRFGGNGADQRFAHPLTTIRLVRKTSTNVLEVRNQGTDAVIGTGTTALAADTWYQISVAVTWTSASVNQVKVWINDTLELTITNQTLAQPSSAITLGNNAANLAYDIYYDDIYIDDDGDASMAYPGDIHVTAKLPAATNTNNFDTTGGSGAARYNYVDDRAIDTANFLRHAGTGDVQENFGIQAASAGDVDITGATILGYTGWAYAKRGEVDNRFIATIGSVVPAKSAHTTTVIPSTTDMTTGNTIVVAFACDDNGNPGTTATCADSQGNTYSAGQSVQASNTGSGAGVRVALFIALDATPLTGSDTITVTHGSITASAAMAFEFSGVVTSNALDKSNSQATAGASNPTTGSTGTLSQADELVVAVIGAEGETTAFTTTLGNGRGMTFGDGGPLYSKVGTTGGGAAGNISVGVQYALVSATTALEGGQTTGPESRDFYGAIGSYKTATNGISVGDPKLMLNGTEYSKTLTTSNALYSQIVTSSSYPSNAAGIGMRSSGTTADTFLYECGVVIAYIPGAGGAISGATSNTFGQSATLTGAGTLAGTAAEVFGQTAALTSSGALAGACALAFANSAEIRAGVSAAASFAFAGAAALSADGALLGESAPAFTPTAALVADAALAASGTITIADAVALTGSGDLASTSAIAFTSSGVLVCLVDGTATLVFADSAALGGEGALLGAAAITFAEVVSLSGSGALTATGTLVFAGMGDLTAQIDGSAEMTFVASALLIASGDLLGTAATTFADSALLIASGDLLGTAAVTFADSAALIASGDLLGTAAVTFADSAALTGDTTIAGTSALVVANTAALTGVGDLMGATAITFALTAVGDGDILGTASIVFADSAALDASGALVGTIAAIFGQSAALTGTGELLGAAAMTFTDTAALTAAGALTGSAALVFSPSGTAQGHNAPASANAACSTTNPTVVLGNTSSTPASREADAVAVAPTVVMGSLALAPTTRAATAVAVAPTVVLGSSSAQPAADTAVAVAVAPTVVLGAVAVTPATRTTVSHATIGEVTEGDPGLATPQSLVARCVATIGAVIGGAVGGMWHPIMTRGRRQR